MGMAAPYRFGRVPGALAVWQVDFESEDPSFQGTMQMEWTLRRVDDGTDVEIVARDVPAVMIGW